MHQRIVFAFVLTMKFLNTLSNGYRFEPNTLTINNYSNCLENGKQSILNYSFSPISRNKYVVNGQMIVDEFMTGPLEVFSRFKNKDFKD